MSDNEIVLILSEIKAELAEIKQQLSQTKKYQDHFPLEKLIEYEYQYRKFLLRFEQRFF